MRREKPMSNPSTVEKTISYIFLILVGVLLASPFLYMISIALASDATNVKSDFTFVPMEFQWSNFYTIFTNNNLGTYLKNSVIITVFTIVGSVLSASIVSYGFA